MTADPEEISLGNPMHIMGPLLSERAHLKGVICEFGVYAGRTTLKLAQFGRAVWAFDTFAGIPAESWTPDLDRDDPGKFYCRGTFERLLREPNVVPVRGRFEETLASLEADLKVVGAYVDADLYLSTRVALDWLALQLVPGGFICVDDYATHPGIRKAADAFLKSNPRANFDGMFVIRWP